MTKPSDAAIAKAFWELQQVAGHSADDGLWVLDRAEEIDDLTAQDEGRDGERWRFLSNLERDEVGDYISIVTDGSGTLQSRVDAAITAAAVGRE